VNGGENGNEPGTRIPVILFRDDISVRVAALELSDNVASRSATPLVNVGENGNEPGTRIPAIPFASTFLDRRLRGWVSAFLEFFGG
jgi:hypothetical protein